jgi:hypothetical protein
MRLLPFILLLICSCTKKSTTPKAFKGVWVETTLRLDTLDFEVNNLVDNGSGYAIADFKTNTYIDTVLNPNYPVNHSSGYHYYFAADDNKIYLRSLFSSFNGFYEFAFSLLPNQQRFTINKFYLRRALPAVIEFVRIK